MRVRTIVAAVLIAVGASAWTAPALAHCDTLDGPVVAAARKALDADDVKLVLVWVRKDDEREIRNAFDKARAVRKAGGDSRELADRYFFETLVRVHRAGEGAGYSGLKPAGSIEPAVAAVDKAVASGRLQGLGKLISERAEKGLHEHFARVQSVAKYDARDVEAGRAYVHAYVEFVHYAERMYDAGASGAQESVHKH